MAHYNCEVKAVLGQAMISLKSTKERDNVVAILIIAEVSPLLPPPCPPAPRRQVGGWDFHSHPLTHRPPAAHVAPSAWTVFLCLAPTWPCAAGPAPQQQSWPVG